MKELFSECSPPQMRANNTWQHSIQLRLRSVSGVQVVEHTREAL